MLQRTKKFFALDFIILAYHWPLHLEVGCIMLRRYPRSKKYKILRDIQAFPHLKEQLMKEHNLSNEELNRWEELFNFRGIEGLQTTRLTEIRKDMENENL